MNKYYVMFVVHIKTMFKILKWVTLSVIYYGRINWFDCFCMVNFGNVNFTIETDQITIENIKNNIGNLKESNNYFNVNIIENRLNILYDHTYIDGLTRANILKNLIKNKKINFTYDPKRIGTNLPFSLLYNYTYSKIFNVFCAEKIPNCNWFSQLMSADELSYFMKQYNASITIITVGLICKYFCVCSGNKNIVFHMFVNRRISEPKTNEELITLGNYIDFIQFEFKNHEYLSDIIKKISLVILQLKTNYNQTLYTNRPTQKPHFIINSWFFISSTMKIKSSYWLDNCKYTESIDNPSGNQSYFIIISPSNDNQAVEFGSNMYWNMNKWKYFLKTYTEKLN